MDSSTSMGYLQNQIQHKEQYRIGKTVFLCKASIRRNFGRTYDVTPSRRIIRKSVTQNLFILFIYRARPGDIVVQGP